MTDDDERDRSVEETVLEIPLPHAEAPSAAPRLLTNRPFLWLVAGDSFATLGRWAFFLAAVGDAAYRLDASPAQVGFILASFSLPLMLASPVYGAVADRWSPKLLLVFSVAASVGPTPRIWSRWAPRRWRSSRTWWCRTGAGRTAEAPGRRSSPTWERGSGRA